MLSRGNIHLFLCQRSSIGQRCLVSQLGGSLTNASAEKLDCFKAAVEIPPRSTHHGSHVIHRHLFLSKRFIHCLCESLNRSYTGALTDHKGLIYFPDSDLSRLQMEQADDVVLVIDAFPDLTSLYVCFERPRKNYILGRSNHL